MKNGPPTRAVRIPKGISLVEISRLTVSTTIRKQAPILNAAGISSLLLLPATSLPMWGTTSPIQPMTPETQTAAAVARVAQTMTKIIAGIIAVLIVCLAMNAMADDTPDQTPEYDLGEVVVTAPEERGVESVGTLHEVTAQQIELRHATTLDRALELLPGLDVRRGAQGIPRVNIRGMRSRHVVLLLNGIPFNSTFDGQFAQLSMGYDPGGLFSLRAWGYLNERDEDLAGYDSDDYTAITNNKSYDKTDETGVTGGTVQGFLKSDTLGQLGFSLNAETNSYDSTGAYGNGNPIAVSHDLSLYAAAMEYEATFFERLGVVAGYSHHWQDKDEGSDDDQGAWLTGLSFDVAEHTRLRASYARKIRFASIKNLYDSDAGNEDLDTETSDNYEIGVTQLLPYGIMADLALFQNNVKDYIQKVEQSGGNDLYENYDEYRFKGVELFLSKQFSKAGASLGYSYMDAENKSEGADFEDLEYRPVHKLTLEGNYTFDFGLIAYASLMYLTDQVYNGDDDQGDLGDITLVDLKIEQRVYKELCSLYLGVDNLFDEDYEESYGFPQAGRTAYAGMKIRF